MDTDRRGIREVAMLLVEAVGRDRSGAEDREVDGSQEGRHENEPAPPHPFTRIRGSSRYRSRSATRLPATRKAAESRIAPSTTGISRAMMASTSSGPSPGQPM